MRGDGEDFAVSLDQERHDEATQSSIAALDAEEASPAHAVALALDVLEDARDALTRARAAQHAAHQAYLTAINAEMRS